MLNSINWYSMFYWITRADSVRDFFDVASTIFITFTVILFIATVISAGCEYIGGYATSIVAGITKWRKLVMKLFFWFLIGTAITWSAWVFTPTKKDCLLIIAGGGTMKFLTTDSATRKIPHELTNFVVSELRSAAQSANIELMTGIDKEKILKEAKNMSSQELMTRMQSDSNFAKIILNK